MAGHPDPYHLLKSIIHLSTSSHPVEAKLEGMVRSILEGFGSNRCFFLKPHQIKEDGLFSRVAKERRLLWVDEESPFQDEKIRLEEKDLLLPGFVCIPLYEENTFQGILYLGFTKSRKFSSQEIDLLILVAKEMERTIQHSHLQQKTEQALSELKALQEMGKAITSTLKLEDLFKLIVAAGLKILKAKGGVLRIEDRKTGELKVEFSQGNYHQNPHDEKIAKRVFFTRTPIFLHHFSEEKPPLSVLCAPFFSKGKSFGTLAFYDKEVETSKFDDLDFQLLLTMTNQISCAIENALIHFETYEMSREHEKRVKQLSTLWELSKALLTTVNFERIIHLTLTAITIGDGLGFNRAILFMVNEKNRILEGTMAVAPDSAEDAGRIWEALSKRKGSPSDLISQVTPPTQSALNAIVKGIQIPLNQEQCILSRTVLDGRPFNIQFPKSGEGWLQTRCERGCHLGSEVGCYVGEHLSPNPKVYSFATVPLWGKGKAIGVILVDNLYNQNSITEEDIHFLSMFSNQAGLAIENAILYRNLEEVHRELEEVQTFSVHQEKMAALGELSATVAHEIKNPLVAIGGFARRLDRSIPEEVPEKRYTQTIMTEVSRLERILNDILIYTHDEPISFKEVDLRAVLDDSLSMILGGLNDGAIQLVKQFPEELPPVIGDSQRLKQAFYNLITNACQAMKDKGTLSLRVYPFSKNAATFVRVEVADTGKGIDPENLHNIFNPFYTTKESSLGLGLPMVHKIVTSHRGQIEVDNRPGEGVTFIITLPAQEAKSRGVENIREKGL